MSFQKDLKVFARVLFGAVNAGVAGFFLWLEYHKSETGTLRVELLVAWIAFGLATMWPTLVLGTAKQIIILLPDVKFGGLRKTDPPKDAP